MSELQRNLRVHQRTIALQSVSNFFSQDSDRAARFSHLISDTILVDFSKHPITQETTGLLSQLYQSSGVDQLKSQLFSGAVVNETEGRPALHMALRGSKQGRNYSDENGAPLNDIVADALGQIQSFCDQVHSGARVGGTGKAFQSIVNIGIGGSDLGPRMVCQALSPHANEGLSVHFVSNVDPNDLAMTLANVDPETTLFVLASKTFTTQETLTNAKAARAWVSAHLPDADIDAHFVAVTAAPDKARDFGIPADAVFPFWDWVGGRYSLWSAIGLPIALYLGFAKFRALLDGASAIDEHFLNAPFEQNVPALMGTLSFYYRNYWNSASHAVLPYDQNLEALPAYLQQLEMESNGKSVLANGSPCEVKTSPVVWGAAGTNAQHSFFQLLHQSKDCITMDLLAAASSMSDNQNQHQLLLANFLAQSRAFMEGQDQETAFNRMQSKGLSDQEASLAAQHSVIAGNRPVTSIVYPKLTPWVLGALIAMYEHRVFVQAALAGINPFDQWGVELGKVLAKEILPALQSNKKIKLDGSTAALLKQFKAWQS